jgi:hypothetical protein
VKPAVKSSKEMKKVELLDHEIKKKRDIAMSEDPVSEPA